jgi:cell wall-associated NlpC family hydrolase
VLARALLTAACVAALAAAPLSSAAADPPGTPSRAEVRDAEDRAADRAEEVRDIQARLTAAQRRLRAVQVESMQATEAYNGAVYRLQRARTAALAAQRRSDRADRAVERQRRALEGFAVGSASDATSVADLATLLSSGGPQELLQEYRAWTDTTSALQADLDGWDASRAVSSVLRDQSDAAMARRAKAAAAAREARAEARAALADAEREEASIQARTDELVRALAHAQQVSVRLAERRQTALAEAAARAAQEAAEQEAADSDAEAPAVSSGAAPQLPSADPPAPNARAAAAIAFARRQLDEPYVYGAAGPASWDCSGLTSQAWAAAGQPLSHWSVAQYGETTPIKPSQLRPGDLAFWSQGSPRSIYHVAMYLGDGMIIHAPRPGRSVETVSMYYWITPDLFGRV